MPVEDVEGAVATDLVPAGALVLATASLSSPPVARFPCSRSEQRAETQERRQSPGEMAISSMSLSKIG
jgi:hypothetical protein